MLLPLLLLVVGFNFSCSKLNVLQYYNVYFSAANNATSLDAKVEADNRSIFVGNVS
jgi:hypothetical protein